MCMVIKVVPHIFFFLPSISRVRTSSGTFLARGRDKIIRNIEKKIADFTFLPAGKLPDIFLFPFFVLANRDKFSVLSIQYAINGG